MKRVLKTIEMVLETVQHIPLEYIVGMSFVLMGISILRFPVFGTMSFIISVTHIPADFVATSLIVSGCVLMTKPVAHIFILATLPFMLYVIFSTLYALMTPSVSTVFAVVYVSYYILMLRFYNAKVEELWIKARLNDLS